MSTEIPAMCQTKYGVSITFGRGQIVSKHKMLGNTSLMCLRLKDSTTPHLDLEFESIESARIVQGWLTEMIAEMERVASRMAVAT